MYMKTITVVEGVINILYQINECIACEKTGNGEKLAAKVGLTYDTFKYYMIGNRKLLAEKGIQIIYDRQRKTFRFSERGRYVIKLEKTWTKLIVEE